MTHNEEEKEKRNPVTDSHAPPAGVAAATALDTSNDITIAQVYNTVEQLTSIFQFTQQQAHDAVEAVGPDVILACNYILDNGGEDKGGAIVPINDCPHLEEHVLLDETDIRYKNVCGYYLEKDNKPTTCIGRMKMDLVEEKCPSGENWLCLHCGVVRCSRYVNGHCKDHWESSGHCVAVSLGDLSVWCFQCSAYLHDRSLVPILKQLEKLKFQDSDGCL